MPYAFTKTAGWVSVGPVAPLDVEVFNDPDTDHFDGIALDASWTSPAVSGQAVTVTVANSTVTIEPAATGTASTGSRGCFGIRKPVAGGDFDVSAKVIDNGSQGGTDDGRIGIWAGDPGNSGQIIGFQNSNTRLVNANQFATFSITAEWGANQVDNFLFPGVPPYAFWYRMVYTAAANTLDMYFSPNGISWYVSCNHAAIPGRTDPHDLLRVGLGSSQ